MTTKTRLTEGERALLTLLVNRGGSYLWFNLTSGQNGIGKELSSRKLAEFKTVDLMEGKRLFITDAGRAALAEVEE